MTLRKIKTMRLKTVDHILFLKSFNYFKSPTEDENSKKLELLQFQLRYNFLVYFGKA
jgi:hypothetical protein